MTDLLTAYASKNGFPGYTEMRAQCNRTRRIVLLNGTMTSNTSSAMGGLSARVVKNGAYGFASSPEYTPESIGRLVKNAADNAELLDSRVHLGRAPFAASPALRSESGLEHEDNTPTKQTIDFISAVDAYIAEKYPSLQSRFTLANCLGMEKLLLTSDGVLSHSLIPRALVAIALTAMCADGTPVELYHSFGGYGSFAERFPDPAALFGEIDVLYEQLMKKREGVYPEPGIKDVILHPDLAGILAHEAVGHTVEADFVLSGSVGGPCMNKRVGSDIVTLVDYANTAFGQQCPQPLWVDDEGTPARDAVLIENGILRGYMHNKESAAYYGAEPTGNARAFAFSDEPLIRMRNTCIVPGKDKLADMIASIDDGYFFVQTGNGQADATGEFMFGVNFGYEIKKGHLARALRDSTISGVAFEVLKTVDMLSDDLSWSCGGMCGKKQMIPVGMGGPAVKCKVNVGGK